MIRFKRFAAVLLSAAMVVTNFNVPVFADTSEEIVIEESGSVEVEESAAGAETTEAALTEEVNTSGMEAETASDKGAGAFAGSTYFEVHNMEELKQAITTSALDGVETTIRLEAPYGMENDIKKYYVSDNLVVPAKRNIVIDTNGQDLVYNPSGVSCNAANPFKLEIAEDASLKLIGYGSTLRISIENSGTFVNEGSTVAPAFGYAVRNNKGATAVLESGSFYAAAKDIYAVYNDGELISNEAYIYSYDDSDSDKGAVYNAGSLTLEKGRVIGEGNSVSVNGIDNMGKDAVLAIRGSYAIKNSNRWGQGIQNIGGTVEIGEESTETYINGIKSVDGGSVTMKAGCVTTVMTAGCMSTKKDTADGTFTMIGGQVGTVIYDKNLPELKFGSVDSDYFRFPYNVPVVKISENGIDPASDITSYKFKALSDVGESVEKSVYKEDANGTIEYNGKKYIGAYEVKNGEPIFDDIHEYETISTNQAFLNAAKNGGFYNVTNTIYVSENVVVEKDLTLMSHDDYGIFFQSKTPVDGKYKAGSLEVAGGVTLDSDVYFYQYGNSLSNNQPLVTNHGTIENVIAYQELENLKKGGSGAVALVNSGIVNKCYVTQNTSGVSENRPVAIQNKVGGVLACSNWYYDSDEEDYICNDYSEVSIQNKYAIAVKNEGQIDYVKLEVTEETDSALVVNEASGTIEDIDFAGAPYWGTKFIKGVVVDNAGELNLHYGALEVSSATAVKNSGTFVMKSGTVKAEQNGTAVENSGTFVMYGGDVYNSAYGKEQSYAISYTEGHEPVLIGGTVYGTRSKNGGYTSISTISTNAAEGSAVVKMNGKTAEKGFFKHAVDGASIDSLNSARINDGNVEYNSTVEINNDKQYALMEKGESVSASSIFRYSARYLDGNTYTFSSKDESVVKCSNVSGNDIFTAVGVGTTTVMVSSNETKAADYATIEVVEEGGRAKLVADNYEANLLVENDSMNANEASKRIAFEWHLKEKATGAEKYFNWADNFKPTQLKITGKSVEDDKDFNEYFDNDTYDVNFDSSTKQYYAKLVTSVDNDGNKDLITRLSRDEVSGFQGLNVTLIVENTASGKTLEIPVTQSLNLAIDQSIPTVQFNTVELNGAYDKDAEYYYSDNRRPNFVNNYTLQSYVKGSSADFDSVRFESYPKGFDGDGTNLFYEGAAKSKKANIPVKVTFKDYVGSYDAVVPVSVKTVYPKVSLNTKAITVPEKASQMEDIRLSFIDKKNVVGLGTIKNVEVIGNSSFKVTSDWDDDYNYVYYDSRFKYYCVDQSFTLQPRADLKKAETVTLKVTYGNLKKKAGKEYSTLVKLNVKPVSQNKFSMKATKATSKPVLYISENAAKTGVIGTRATVRFDFTPSYYTNGYVKVTTSANNLTVTNGNSRNVLYINVNENTKITDKKATFSVDWFAADGTKLTKKPVKVTVTLVSGAPSVTVADEVTIDINKPYAEAKNIYGETYETTDLSMGVPLKTSVKNAYYDYCDGKNLFYYDDEAGKIIPDLYALQVGKIVPGATYEMKLYYCDMLGNRLPEKTVKIHVKEVKTAKAAIVQKEVKLSKRAAHSKAMFAIDTIQPYYCMKVKSVELSGRDAESFEVINHTYDWNGNTNETSARYALTYKENKLRANLKAGSKKVDLIVTYENGATAKVKLPVVIY